MVSIAEIVQQYTEMRQGLKQLTLELELFWPNPEDQKVEIAIVENTNLNHISELDEEDALGDSNIQEGSMKQGGSVKDASIFQSSSDTECEGSIQEDVRSICSKEHSQNNSEDTKMTSIQQDSQEGIYTQGDTDAKDIDGQCQTDNNNGKFQKEIQPQEQENTPINHDRFMQVMKEFRESANDRFEELEALYVNVDFKWKDIMKYYGESPKTMKPDEFFQIFAKFIKSWKIAAVEELKYTEGIERDERRKQESEEKRRVAYENSDSDSLSSENNDRRIMDNLMEELRSGKGENKMRQRRVRERLRRIKNEEDRLKKEEETIKPIVERRRAAPLSVIISRRDSMSSLGSSEQIPVISAEELLRRLQQENDETH